MIISKQDRPHSATPDKTTSREVFIDAGIEHIHIRTYGSSPWNNSEILTNDIIIKNNDDIQKLFHESGIMDLICDKNGPLENGGPSIYITGKLSEIVQKVLKRGESITPAAALWTATSRI